jgi:excinuclease UvrABC nuclease subunit
MDIELTSLFEKVADYAPGADAKLPAGGGVYLLTDEHDRPIQLAAAADLGRALRHRLNEKPQPSASPTEPASATTAPTEAESVVATPESPPANASELATSGSQPASASPLPARRRLNLGQIVRRIYWQPAHSVFELTYAYYRIARRLHPADYLRQVAFGPAWFVHVDPAAAIPRFQAGKLLRGRPGTDIGPMATQADAVSLVELLQDAFDLCRYHHILEQTPHGQPCAYFEMGRCPAPCNGSILMTAYRASIEAALRFALGQREELYQRLTVEMREAAAARAFERAGMLKQRLDRARRVEHEAFRFLAPVDAFDWLIVQRGGGSTRVRPFFVRAGLITPGAPVPMKSLESAVPQWIEQVRNPSPESSPALLADLQARSEQVWLVSHFLFKPNAPGMYFRPADVADPVALTAAIRERFRRPERPAQAEGEGRMPQAEGSAAGPEFPQPDAAGEA